MKPLRLTKLALVGTALLAGLFLSVLFREDATLGNSLVDLSILPPVRRNAVLHTAGTVLRGALASRTLTKAEGPYLLRGLVRVPRGATVHLEPGTVIAAEEHARFVVEGTVTADGSSWFSNHLHPQRRLWDGIIAADGGTVQLTNVRLADASAALTCARGGSLTVRGGTFSENAASLVSLPAHRSCTLADARIVGGRVGLHLVGGTPTIQDTSFDRVGDALRVFHEARPLLRTLTVSRPLGSAVRYAARPDLFIRGLTVPPVTDARAGIIDGAAIPTHRWQGQEHPTGKVRFR